MQDFQIQILSKLTTSPGSLTYGEFQVAEGIVDAQINYIDPTSRFNDDVVVILDKIGFTIQSLISGITNPLVDLHALKKYINDVRLKQRDGNQLTDFGRNPHNSDNYKNCVGSTIASAMPMTMEQYNYLQGWVQPYDKDPKEKGYLIVLIGSKGTNHPAFQYPITWVNESVFESNYRTDGNLRYGDALVLLKSGERLMRSGWNGKNMFVEIRQGFQTTEYVDNERIDFTHGEYSAIVNMNNKTISVWVPSPTDHLAEDWSVYQENY